MKKLLLMLLVLVGGVVNVSATDYYVIGDLTQFHYVPSTVSSAKMTASATEGLYYFDYTSTTTDTKYFHIADGDGSDWTDYNSNHRFSSDKINEETSGGVYSMALGNHDERNLQLTGDGSSTYRIILNAQDADNLKLTVTILNQDYIVAGAFSHDGTNTYESGLIFTSDWSETETANSMNIQDDGTYAITYSGVNLPVGGYVTYKVIKDKDWNTATKDNQSCTILKAGTYDIKITLYINNIDGPVISATETGTSDDFYLIGSTNWNVSGEALEKEGTVYSRIFSGKSGYSFIIAHSSALNGSITWDNCIRPNESKTISDFVAVSGDKHTGGNYNWTISTDDDVKFSYDTNTEKWTITPYRTTTISDALYATWSNDEKYTVSGATAYTVSAKNTSSVTLTAMSADAVYPVGTGLILNGASGATVTINAVASDATTTEIGTNYLKGSGNSNANISKGDDIYVFSWDGSTPSSVGFYKASADGTLEAHKAYLDLTGVSGAREFLGFSFDDEPSGISEVGANATDSTVYNLQGVRIGKLQKGINIVNGKKVMVK